MKKNFESKELCLIMGFRVLRSLSRRNFGLTYGEMALDNSDFRSGRGFVTPSVQYGKAHLIIPTSAFGMV